MPSARIDLIRGKPPEYRAAVAGIVYRSIVDVLEVPDGDRFVVAGEHTAGHLLYDLRFLSFSETPDVIPIQLTGTVGDNKDTKSAVDRSFADETELILRLDDIMTNMVFVDKDEWSFGDGQPW